MLMEAIPYGGAAMDACAVDACGSPRAAPEDGGVPAVSPSIYGAAAAPPTPAPTPPPAAPPAPISVTNVVALANPAPWATPLAFEVTFECERALPDDVEWAMVYVGSADDSRHDQVLAEVDIGPVPVGTSRFVLSGDPPDAARIPEGDVLGVTVVLLTCAYRGAEFLKIGYYVHNACPEGEVPAPHTVTRTILADQPRVTRVDVDWASVLAAAPSVSSY